ncbi:condensation domain-containing protein [Gordonia insulae]|uniref:SL659 acyltransferase papA1 n=1 Tax=Gordonia insulae TaxID=2420509 RepID=A0A3G8JIC3_9ACTN|nr:condensation domain-containing protein [Gordonia insulae]AZG44841.1 SL659 acyltransferase papA1 [Gordonia insulae]
MSRTPLLHFPLVGGTTVQWRLADPEGALAAAERTPDGVTFLQSDHLVAAAAKQGRGETHTGTASAVTVFDGPLDRPAMAAALTAFTRRHEELRAVYGLDDTGPVRRVAPAEVTEYVTVEHGAHLADDDDVIGHIVDRIETEAIFDRMPGVIYGAVDAGDRFTFYIGTDHAHTDGFSQFLGLHEIARLYRGFRDGDVPRPADAGTFGDYIAAEKAIVATADPLDPRIAQWREILSANDGRVPRFPFDIGLADGEPALARPIQRTLLSGNQLDACDAHGGARQSFVGVIYAALAAAQHELLGSERYFTATVLATRPDGHASTQGWLCNFAPVEFPVAAGTPFSSVVSAAGDAVARARDLATLPVHVALAVLAADGSYIPDEGSPQMVSYIDFRKIPGSDDPVLQRVTCFPAIGLTRNANMWFTRYTDKLTMLAHIPDNPTARSTFDAYADAVQRWLTAYAEGADPSIGANPRIGASS